MMTISSAAPAHALYIPLRRATLFAGCALAVSLLSDGSAFAGCASGNVAASSLLSDPACQASAIPADTTAVGAGANAGNFGASAFGNSATAGAGR